MVATTPSAEGGGKRGAREGGSKLKILEILPKAHEVLYVLSSLNLIEMYLEPVGCHNPFWVEVGVGGRRE